MVPNRLVQPGNKGICWFALGFFFHSAIIRGESERTLFLPSLLGTSGVAILLPVGARLPWKGQNMLVKIIFSGVTKSENCLSRCLVSWNCQEDSPVVGKTTAPLLAASIGRVVLSCLPQR